jgi:glycosyltransferase involved in cell wall biosynthesis
MQRKHRISIVTPSFNQAAFLEETIVSVLDQGYPNLEYIIVDGGSTDHSVEIIRKYEKHLSYWISEPDSGMYEAIAKGFDKSTGDVMAWINSDDIFFASAFKRVSDIFERYPLIQWLGGCTCHIDEHSDVIFTRPQEKWNKYKYYRLQYQYIQQEGTFWRRSLWNKAGAHINTTYRLAADLELWLRFFQHAEYYTLNLPLGCFRVRSNNQKSLEQRNTYDEEAKKAITSFPIPASDITHLKRDNFYQTYISRLPVIRRLAAFKDAEVTKFPASFTFDQKRQQFILSE